MYGYVRRVCHIPAQKLYTQADKLRVRRGTDMYGGLVISRHKNYTPNSTNYGTGEKDFQNNDFFNCNNGFATVVFFISRGGRAFRSFWSFSTLQ